MRTVDLGHITGEDILLLSFDIASREDADRVCDQLTAFTEKKHAPEYSPLRLVFRAASETGHTLGEVIATELWGKLEIDHMHVEEDMRGKGIGKALMAYVDQYAARHDITAIRLNTPSWQGEGFYERCGYTEMGRIPLQATLDGKQQYEVTYFKSLTP